MVGAISSQFPFVRGCVLVGRRRRVVRRCGNYGKTKKKRERKKEKDGIEYNGNKHQPVYQVGPLARPVHGLNKRPFLLVVIIAGGLKAGVIFTRVRGALIAVLLSPRKRGSCRGKKLSFFFFFFSPAITIFPAIGILWDFFL